MARIMARNHAKRGIPQRQTKKRTDDTWWAISDQPHDVVGFLFKISIMGVGEFLPPTPLFQNQVETLIRFSRALFMWLF